MLVKKAVQLVVLAAVMLLESTSEAGTTSSVKLCGRKLSDIMSKVCHVYNSPTWDDPTVVEQPTSLARRKRQIGIADQCCTFGCTWGQLNEYCAISTNSESPLDAETHMIEDRSAEPESGTATVAQVPAEVPVKSLALPGSEGFRREGYVEGAARAAPVLGTVSPSLTWGRTLNTDLPPDDRNRFAYIAVYT